jgi:hypothetical protein
VTGSALGLTVVILLLLVELWEHLRVALAAEALGSPRLDALLAGARARLLLGALIQVIHLGEPVLVLAAHAALLGLGLLAALLLLALLLLGRRLGLGCYNGTQSNTENNSLGRR